MLPTLSEVDARILGCLMEKSVVTPAQYPMTLNALTNACNQKSSRDPVMSLEKFEVQRIVRQLDARHLMRIEENFKSGTEKYLQRLFNTRHSDFQLDSAQFAVMCVLLLRGPRTPGELKTNCSRLHKFSDSSEVVTQLNSLMEIEGGPLVVKLPRTPGRKDAEYMHLLSGPVDVAAYEAAAASRTPAPARRTDQDDLEQRVSQLEAEIAELKKALNQS